MQSQDIRQLVQKEGKSARNLVAWSVPASDLSPDSAAREENNNDGFQTVTKRIRKNRQCPRPKINSYINGSAKRSTQTKTTNVSSSNEKRAGPVSTKVSEEMCKVVAEHYSDIHAKQRNESSKLPRIDLHARYWSYLFDNLHRAVDEIYATCEADESVIECQVLCYLGNCVLWFILSVC